MHLCLENWAVVGRTVVCYAQAAHAFSAGIKKRPVDYFVYMLKAAVL